MAVTKLAVAEKHMSPHAWFGDLLAMLRPFVIKDGRLFYPATAFGTDVCESDLARKSQGRSPGRFS